MCPPPRRTRPLPRRGGDFPDVVSAIVESDIRPESVREFWFGGVHPDDADLEERIDFWFAAGPAVDGEIVRRFTPAVRRALAGGLDAWRQSPRECLALVILLDQFPRNIYRGTPAAYSGDEKACALSVEAIDNGADRELSILERAFLYMPLQHAEDLSAQERSIEAFRRLLHASPERLELHMKRFLASAATHCDIIRRFGRFPHRNAVLGRECTKAENEFLRMPTAPFRSKS